MKWPFPKAAYIKTDAELHRLTDKLAGEPLLAIDTESNSLYAYRERVCLIQISTRSADYIIDPLEIADMQPLAPLLANPKIEKVFHAAEYDLICMKRDYGFEVTNLFDTMIAARICGYKAVGLGNLLEDFAGVKADKSHQRDNWGQRPLEDASLLYAQMDTHYLLLLREQLHEKLVELGRWPEALEAFVEATQVEAVDLSFDPDGYWRIGLPNQLTRRQMAILRELYGLREQIAEQRDLPPFKVFPDRTLVALSQIGPQSPTDLYGIDGVSGAHVRRYGKQFLEAIARGMHGPLPPPPPRQPATDPEAVECYSALREWRKLRAMERGVESDVIISKEAMWTLAHRMPDSLENMQDIPGLGPWRMQAYGMELLDVVRKFKNGK